MNWRVSDFSCVRRRYSRIHPTQKIAHCQRFRAATRVIPKQRASVAITERSTDRSLKKFRRRAEEFLFAKSTGEPPAERGAADISAMKICRREFHKARGHAKKGARIAPSRRGRIVPRFTMRGVDSVQNPCGLLRPRSQVSP